MVTPPWKDPIVIFSTPDASSVTLDLGFDQLTSRPQVKFVVFTGTKFKATSNPSDLIFPTFWNLETLPEDNVTGKARI